MSKIEKADKAKEKRKVGRPRKEINYTQLDELCRIQCTGEECANILGMAYEHLDRKLKEDGHGGFVEYFQRKSADGKASLRRRQYLAAVEDGNPTMLVWLGKQWLKQVDKQEVEHTGTVKMVVLDGEED